MFIQWLWYMYLVFIIVSVSCITCYKGCLSMNGACSGCEPGYVIYRSNCRDDKIKCFSFRDLFSYYECKDGLGNPACFSLSGIYGYSCFPMNNLVSACVYCETFCELCSFSECMRRYIFNDPDITEQMVKNCLNSSVSCAYACSECEEICLKGYYWNVTAKIVNACQACSNSCAERSCNGRNGHCSKGCVDNRFWGARCEKPCPEQCLYCKQSTGKCLGCRDDYKFGTLCEHNCSDRCHNATCNFENGKCSLGCSEGFFGNYCQFDYQSVDAKCNICISRLELYAGCKECRPGYYPLFNTSVGLATCQECSKNCLNRNCSSMSGYCIQGCVGGRFWGKQCEKECASNCLECGQEMGTCRNCTNNTYGSQCQYKCPTSCKNTTCDIERGTCTLGCIDGYFGYSCEQRCDSEDLGCFACNTDNRGLYDACYECRNGYYFVKSKLGLSKECRACSFSCIEQSCDVTTGYCTIGCVNRTWGSFCELNCSERCVQCSQNNGECLLCKEGLYGELCDLECPNMCLERKCDLQNGSCIGGCKTGHKGGMCDVTCSGGCWNNACDQWTGRCVQGCLPGRSGFLCEEPNAELYSHYNFVPGVATAATVFMCFGGIFLGFFAYIRKRMNRHTTSSNDKDAPGDPDYDEICEELYEYPTTLFQENVPLRVDAHTYSTTDSEETPPDQEAENSDYLSPVYVHTKVDMHRHSATDSDESFPNLEADRYPYLTPVFVNTEADVHIQSTCSIPSDEPKTERPAQKGFKLSFSPVYDVESTQNDFNEISDTTIQRAHKEQENWDEEKGASQGLAQT